MGGHLTAQLVGCTPSTSGRLDGLPLAYAFSRRQHAHRLHRTPPPPSAATGQHQSGGLGEGLRKLARQVQGALPIVGLLSRLSAPSGGIGNDLQTYPEYARALLESASVGFNAAVSEWEKRHGKAGQRRYVLLFLWMAAQGGGVVAGKTLANAARRLRVTQDIEIEVERFENARDAIYKEYVYVEKPKGRLREKMDVAVDCMCRLSLGLVDGAEVPEDDAALLVSILSGAFSAEPEAEEAARASVQQRASRRDAYVI